MENNTNNKIYYTFKGRITDIVKKADQVNTIVTGIKGENQGYYDYSRRYAGSNGTYLEFGEYKGMKLDVKFSLYDTDKKFIDLGGESYRMPPNITYDIYDSCKALLKFQRMSSNIYNGIRSYIGKKSIVTLTVLNYEKYDNNALATIGVSAPFSFSEDRVPTGTCEVVLQKVQ